MGLKIDMKFYKAWQNLLPVRDKTGFLRLSCLLKGKEEEKGEIERKERTAAAIFWLQNLQIPNAIGSTSYYLQAQTIFFYS